MHGSTHFLSQPTFAEIHCSCDKVYHKQELRFLLYILGQSVTWHYIPSPLIKIDHDLLYMIMMTVVELSIVERHLTQQQPRKGCH